MTEGKRFIDYKRFIVYRIACIKDDAMGCRPSKCSKVAVGNNNEIVPANSKKTINLFLIIYKNNNFIKILKLIYENNRLYKNFKLIFHTNDGFISH